MKINSYRLIPGKVAYWGDIVGNISDQTDLVEYISSHGGGGTEAIWGSISGNISDQSDLMNLVSSFATESWVQSQGYLTSVPSGYATESWVESQGYLTSVPEGYATESWVSDQEYITSSSLEGYATQSWVTSNFPSSEVMSVYAKKTWVEAQGYLTSSSLDDYATQPWVQSQGYLTSSSLEGYATESWVESQSYVSQSDSAVAPLYDRKEGYLRNHIYTPDVEQTFCSNGTQFFDQYGQCYVWTIGGVVYGINFLTPEVDEQNVQHIYIYKYNTTIKGFVHCLDVNDQWIEINGDVTIPMINDVATAHFLWEDSQGRVYYSNTHTVDLTTGTFTAKNMGGVVQTYNGSKSNLIKHNGKIYLLNATSTTAGTCYLFDETTQTFSSVGSMTGHGNKNFFRYGFYFLGKYYTMMTNTLGGITTKQLSTVSGSDRVIFNNVGGNLLPFPTSITDEGTTYKIDGQHIRSTYDSLQDAYEYYFVFDDKMWYLSGGHFGDDTWVKIAFYQDPGITYNANGAECNDYMVGFGYSKDEDGGLKEVIPVWNFSPTTQRSIYGWDNSIETRVSTLEESIGDAEAITQNILGY